MDNNTRDIDLEKQIDAYIKGNLSQEEAENLWVELLKRPDYIDLLETELAVKHLVEEEQESRKTNVTPISKEQIKRSWKWLAAAASVAILVIAINLLKMDSQQTVQEMALSDINQNESLIAPDVLRSQGANIDTIDSLMNVGFRAAISGEVDRALKIYDQIIADYGNTPKAAEAYLNLGIIKYNIGDFEEASMEFAQAIDKVQDDRLVEEKAYWYMGNALINLDRLEEARDAIHSAYVLDGIYRRPAFRLLRKVDYQLGNVDFDNFEEQIKEGEE